MPHPWTSPGWGAFTQVMGTNTPEALTEFYRADSQGLCGKFDLSVGHLNKMF